MGGGADTDTAAGRTGDRPKATDSLDRAGAPLGLLLEEVSDQVDPGDAFGRDGAQAVGAEGPLAARRERRPADALHADAGASDASDAADAADDSDAAAALAQAVAEHLARRLAGREEAGVGEA